VILAATAKYFFDDLTRGINMFERFLEHPTSWDQKIDMIKTIVGYADAGSAKE